MESDERMNEETTPLFSNNRKYTVNRYRERLFDQIPNEILKVIFSFICEGYQLQNIRRVCKKWKILIDSSYSLWIDIIENSPIRVQTLGKSETKSKEIYLQYEKTQLQKRRARKREELNRRLGLEKSQKIYEIYKLSFLMDIFLAVLLLVQMICASFYLEKFIPILLFALLPTFIAFGFIFIYLIYIDWNIFKYGLISHIDLNKNKLSEFSFLLQRMNSKLGRFLTWFLTSCGLVFFLLLGIYFDTQWIPFWYILLPFDVISFSSFSFVYLMARSTKSRFNRHFLIIILCLLVTFVVMIHLVVKFIKTSILILNQFYKPQIFHTGNLDWSTVFGPLILLTFLSYILPCLTQRNLSRRKKIYYAFTLLSSLFLSIFLIGLYLRVLGNLNYVNWFLQFIPIYLSILSFLISLLMKLCL